MLTPFERGLVAHLIADWIFQNDSLRVAKHKTNLSDHSLGSVPNTTSHNGELTPNRCSGVL